MTEEEIDKLVRRMCDTTDDIRSALHLSEQVMLLTFKNVEIAWRAHRDAVSDYNKATGNNVKAEYIYPPEFPKTPNISADIRAGEKKGSA